MSYEAKTDWKYDETVTEGDLNRIEQGIKEAHEKSTENEDDLATHLADYTKHVGDGEAHGIGKRSNLKTESKNTIVQAVNELYDTKQKSIYIQATEPTSPRENDIWIEVEP